MISVLTVNYRSAPDLALLAESLRCRTGDTDVELIVTNNSREQLPDLAGGQSLRVKVIPSANVGYAAGINLAYRQACGDVIFVANPDVRILTGTFEAAIARLNAESDIGAILPMLRHPDGGVQLSVRRFYTWPVVMYARSPFRLLARKPGFFREYLCEDLDRTAPADVDWGLGGAMFLRRADCGRDAIFDERFFLYFEDVDLCYRIWQGGRRVVYCPEIECTHAHRRMSRIPFTRAGWHHFRSLAHFIAKHRGLPRRPACHG